VNESVKLAKQIRGKGGGGFVNAILRSIQREKGEIPYPDIGQDPVFSIAITHSHPSWLIRRWVKEMGLEETLRICRFNNQISPLTLRTNTLKIKREDLIELFDKQGINVIPTRFSEEGILLRDPFPTAKLPFFNQGVYLIQDEASQLVSLILNPEPGERILDACAAPGGKTTHMAQRMGDKGEIYAMDLSQRKLRVIQGISHKMEVSIVKTMLGDATHPLPVPKGFKFDRVLADVPCSGFGTLRKNPDLKWRRKEEDIQRLSQLQYSILENLSSYVKEGGILVYSTCTVFQEENEGVVEKFLNQHPQFQLDRIGPILPRTCHPFLRKGYFATFPPKYGMDGFFAARLVKHQ
jgi:16S rRNA (cytosine967-C5)-methyltransferase